MRKLYFCIGCEQIHYDEDFNEKDGDILIENIQKLKENIHDIEEIIKREKKYFIYICKTCGAQLNKSDMGIRCPDCGTWTYNSDCIRLVDKYSELKIINSKGDTQ